MSGSLAADSAVLMQAAGAPPVARSVEVLEYVTCKSSLQNGIQNTNVQFLPFFILFFSQNSAAQPSNWCTFTSEHLDRR